MRLTPSSVLKISLFATGLSGIVAEYVLATMASYFLGDSVFQWTMIISLMLFAMGLGSRLSRLVKTRLLEAYITVELILSLVATFSGLFIYLIMPHTGAIDVMIYGVAILVGLLIGMEIPLVTRMNSEYEALRLNISSVMEKDYYGSLLGGLFFAFIGIRFLGLTWTPFIVGGVNLAVALLVLYHFRAMITGSSRQRYVIGSIAVVSLFGAGLVFAKPIVEYGNQSQYNEQVVFTTQTPYQQITITQWKDHHWLYLNQGKQLSTFDEWMYHEPLVHPVVGLTEGPIDVLVMGAGDGCAIRELLKYDRVKSITLVDLDSVMTSIGAEHPIFRRLNQDAFHSHKVEVVNTDAFHYLDTTHRHFDVMIADFPDPRTVELNKLYSFEFYQLCKQQLRPHGAFITQASSPYYTTKAFRCIEKTMTAAGLNTLPIHNHVYTFGEWGWIIGSPHASSENIKARLRQLDFSGIEGRWLTPDAMDLITSFGQDLMEIDTATIDVNTMHRPVIYRYYEEGNWSFEF